MSVMLRLEHLSCLENSKEAIVGRSEEVGVQVMRDKTREFR